MKNETLSCYNCGFPNEMIYRQCKIICQNCGAMLDCSDLDVGNEIKQASLQQKKSSHKSNIASRNRLDSTRNE